MKLGAGERGPVPAKSTWPVLPGAPCAFVGLFGLRAFKMGKEGVGQLRDWSVHATSIEPKCRGVCECSGYIGVLVMEMG